MIKYRLKCRNCEKSFDSWFSSSKEFDKLRKKNFLNCHFCNSKNIVKTLMAPNIVSSKNCFENKIKIKRNNNIKKRILEFQNFIKNNFENVGDDFAYKARTLHYHDKKIKKVFMEMRRLKQIKELNEEGIETQIFPWIDNNNN